VRTEIYSLNDWDRYAELFFQLYNNLDIYYHPVFLKAEADLIQGEPFVYTQSDSNDNLLLYPFIKRKIPVNGFENYYDITSPYGYCGPVWIGTDRAFRENAEFDLCNYLISENVINEFVRYHYLFNKELRFNRAISNIPNRKIVVSQGESTWENIWLNEYSATNRNLIRKLEKEKYLFYESNDSNVYDHFINMYYKTMQHVEAEKMYFFPRQYFLDLKSGLGNSLKLFIVEKDGIIFNAALFFSCGKIATYFLSARNLDFPKVAGTNFLLARVQERFYKEGFSIFNLGGGTNEDPLNLLLKFKSNFSKNTTDFIIGKRVHLPEIQNKILDLYQTQYSSCNKQFNKHLLQFYR
jgi:hypothetical protein